MRAATTGLGGTGQGPEGHGEREGARDEAILTDEGEGEVNGDGVPPACRSPDRPSLSGAGRMRSK